MDFMDNGMSPAVGQMQNSAGLRVEDHGPVRILTMARPERRNALSLAVMEELRSTLLAAGADAAVSVVVIAANGPVFSSGHDLRELYSPTPAAADALFAACSRLMESLHAIPQPVIAEVQGLATAAGCQLVAACDLALAADTAQFATPGVRIGLFCSTPMVALTRAIGRKRAMEMLLTGRLVGAVEAADWGLINHAVPAAQLRDATMELALQIAAASGATVATGKRAFYEQIEQPEREAYERMQRVMAANALDEDAQEGICAFLEKRKPLWRRR
jgi:enoyl-CoA hydratase/carnithine racemase